jgi:hypothetical protein
MIGAIAVCSLFIILATTSSLATIFALCAIAVVAQASRDRPSRFRTLSQQE